MTIKNILVEKNSTQLYWYGNTNSYSREGTVQMWSLEAVTITVWTRLSGHHLSEYLTIWLQSRSVGIGNFSFILI